jgi:hypothetical protein
VSNRVCDVFYNLLSVYIIVSSFHLSSFVASIAVFPTFSPTMGKSAKKSNALSKSSKVTTATSRFSGGSRTRTIDRTEYGLTEAQSFASAADTFAASTSIEEVATLPPSEEGPEI